MEFSQFTSVSQAGFFFWNVNCAHCGAQIITKRQRLRLDKEQFHQDITRDPPLTLFCSKKCKKGWLLDNKLEVEEVKEEVEEEIKTYSCEMCDYMTSSERGLSIHVSRKHKAPCLIRDGTEVETGIDTMLDISAEAPEIQNKGNGAPSELLMREIIVDTPKTPDTLIGLPWQIKPDSDPWQAKLLYDILNISMLGDEQIKILLGYLKLLDSKTDYRKKSLEDLKQTANYMMIKKK